MRDGEGEDCKQSMGTDTWWRQGEYGIEDVDGGQENERMVDKDGGHIEISWHRR